MAVLVLLAGGFFWYVSDYYRAEDVALEVLASGDHLEVRDDLTILSPSYPTDTAIIFYPGAKAEAADHAGEVDGLILLGAYLYGDYSPADTLTIYGSLNQSAEDKIDYTENVVEIEGGNHAQFGNYRPQKGDLPAAISAEEQQAQTVEAISDFIARRSNAASPQAAA